MVIPWLLALMLIVGAVVQPWTNRAGKWLLIAGAFSVTMVSTESFIAQSLELRGSLFSSSLDFNTIALPLFLLVLTILIVWCDVWLIVYAMKSRYRSKLPDDFHPVNLLVWLAAAGASAVFIPVGVHECILLLHHVVGAGLHDVPPLVLPGLALAVLDGALLIQGVRSLHAYLFQRNANSG